MALLEALIKATEILRRFGGVVNGEATEEELDAARANKLREMLIAGIDTGDVQVEGMKCLVCHEEITPEELPQMSAEFKLYPAHQDCFDSFDSADEFLAFAAEPAMGCRARI